MFFRLKNLKELWKESFLAQMRQTKQRAKSAMKTKIR